MLAAYQPHIESLQQKEGFQSVDVIRITPDTPQIQMLRAKFLQEHTHDDAEIRFFVEGSGAFYLHIDKQVLRLLCERGDLISVPAGVRHWFDIGKVPLFTAIRFFTSPDGWVARYTNDSIAERF